MAIRTKVAGITGTRQAPIVLITVFDDAHGTLDYSAALAAAVAAAPLTIMGAQIKTSEITISEKSRDAITFEMGYVGPGRNVLFISTTAQTRAKKMYHFLNSVGVYTDGSGTNNSSSFSELKTKLDRINSSSEFNAGKPVTIEPKNATTNWNFQTSQSYMTDAYFDLVQDFVNRGVWNNANFLGRPAATLQLISFSATQHDLLDWELNFGIAYWKPELNIFVDSTIYIPVLRGCDYYWLYENPYDLDSKMQPKVDAAFVGQVWPLDDFTKLNLPFQGTLTNRSTATNGSITTLYEHGMTSSDDLIIYWDGGRAYANITSTGSITLNFDYTTPSTTAPYRGGDALPPQGTNVLITKQVV